MLSTCSKKKLILIGFIGCLIIGLAIKYLLLSVINLPVKYNCQNLLNGYFIYALVLPVLIVAILLTHHYVEHFKFRYIVSLAWGLVLAGGAGNAYERITSGCVRDYLNFFNLFYINIFDIMVVFGLLVIVSFVMFKDIFKGA